MSIKSLSCAQYLVLAHQAQFGCQPTPMKLLKLVYLAHAYMLGHKSKPLLLEPVANGQYGPLVLSVYKAVRNFCDKPVTVVEGHEEDYPFTEDERFIMDGVVRQYGGYSAVTLSAAMHQPGSPWSVSQSADFEVIPNTLIYQFYRDNLAKRTFSTL